MKIFRLWNKIGIWRFEKFLTISSTKYEISNKLVPKIFLLYLWRILKIICPSRYVKIKYI